MTRYQYLLSIYKNFDSIYAGLFLLVVWAASTGHLVDWLTQRTGQILVVMYWMLIILLYVVEIIALGLSV
jgi:hypothetical protein